MVEEVTPETVAADLDTPTLEVVDIRDPDDYHERHIPESVNVPFDDLEAVVEEREWDEEIVVICYVGETSKQAARFLDHYTDAEVTSMAGGFESWTGVVETSATSTTD